MPLLIDGYNLLNVTGILGRGRGPGSLERARQALLNTLVESLPGAEVARTTVVFDASESPWGVAREQRHQGMTVIFASRDEDADTVIERLIAADSSPKRLTVVSSDHRLQRAAKRRRALAIDSDKWFAQVLRDRAIRSSPSSTADLPKPEGPLTTGEVAHWLSEFGFEES
jgi:predicted RNA-binding protein with PIN domain